MAPLNLTPLSSLRISKHFIPPYKLIPNTSQKPLLIYHACIQPSSTPSNIESHLSSTGVVTPQWRYSMYPTTHFHSTTHEVLCISRGAAKLCFGHEDNPRRIETSVSAGDVIIVPAGVGHRLLEDISSPEDGDFEMVGSYPNGHSWDMCYGKASETRAIQGISKLAWFDRDPIYGDKGPVLDV